MDLYWVYKGLDKVRRGPERDRSKTPPRSEYLREHARIPKPFGFELNLLTKKRKTGFKAVQGRKIDRGFADDCAQNTPASLNLARGKITIK